MENEQVKLIADLIEFMDEHAVNIDGPFKVSALKTVAAYYENLTHAEGLTAILARSFSMMN